ncbi:cysteine methyltransferase [Pseudolysobacter antarcticus]|uniref:Cysteine methyltransferase n=1 Tax=Pseudolysobacter antarcticus TaxID=2511995 RepID=A0A411HHG0_9GAMM|nr:MGMT family protein [Pseudolysobacter antarcticus]QBB69958.1 cysteine methyltransferase [Pseudolysobacter antarcticus]
MPKSVFISALSAEQRKIVKIILSIPRGRVASYGDIAARAGQTGRARLVGRLLRIAPEEMKLPWHRVLRSDGRSAFTEGSASYLEQLRRWKSEGVAHKNGKVDLARFGWQSDLDAQLWGPR